MKNHVSFSMGFTLIELMIAISIGSLVLTLGTARYMDFNKTQTIKEVGLTVKNNLRQIQTKATTGVKPASAACTSSVSLDGYQITISNTSITSTAVCNGSTSGNPVTTYNLPAGLFFDSSGSTIFNVLGKGVSVAKQILIKNSSTSPSKWYALYIRASGEIKDCGYTSDVPPVCN